MYIEGPLLGHAQQSGVEDYKEHVPKSLEGRYEEFFIQHWVFQSTFNSSTVSLKDG